MKDSTYLTSPETAIKIDAEIDGRKKLLVIARMDGYAGGQADTIEEVRELLEQVIAAFDPVGIAGNDVKAYIQAKHDALNNVRDYLEDMK